MWFDEMNVFEQYLVSAVGTVVFGIGHCVASVDDMPIMVMVFSAIGLFFCLMYRMVNSVKPLNQDDDQPAPHTRMRTQIFNFDAALAEGKIVPYTSKGKTVYQINRDDMPIEYAFISILYQGRIINGLHVASQDSLYSDYVLHDVNDRQAILRVFMKHRTLLKLVS